MIHMNICATFDMSFAIPLQTALLYCFKKYIFYRTQHIMPFCSNSVNQIGLKAKIKEEVVKTARAICVM